MDNESQSHSSTSFNTVATNITSGLKSLSYSYIAMRGTYEPPTALYMPLSTSADDKEIEVAFNIPVNIDQQRAVENRSNAGADETSKVQHEAVYSTVSV
jgi:hypothetical protein